MLIPDMEWIPDGIFTMGNNDVWDANPPHQVTLISGFYMSKYQVTQKQWETVMGTTIEDQEALTSTDWGLFGVGDNHPMYYVSWYDAIVFCNRLSIMEGLSPVYSINNSTDPGTWGSIPYYNESANVGDTAPWDAVAIVAGSTYRLPTEAQWEYACRAGTTTAYYWGDEDDHDTVDQYAWYWENSSDDINEVGLKTANAFGLHDMSGNVWEWCWDWYGDYTSTAKTDPVGASSGSDRVARGGNWGDSVVQLQSAYRAKGVPIRRDNVILGFRVLRP